MTKYLCGFDMGVPLPGEDIVAGDGVGYTASEWAQSIFLPGANLYYGIRDLTKPADAAPERSFSASDPTQTYAYRLAQARLAASQASGQAPTSPSSYAITPVQVPSYTLDTAPAPLPGSTFVSPFSANPFSSIQGDAMPDASITSTALAELAAKKSGLHASISPDGSASCPNCGCPLRVTLDECAPVPPAAPAGAAVVVGEDSAPSAVLKAVSPGCCLLACPKCGVPICLSLTAQGYTGLDHRAAALIGAAAASKRKAARPKKPAPGRAKTTQGVSKGKSPHKASIVRSGLAVKRTLAEGLHAQTRAAKYDPKRHKPLVPLAQKSQVVGHEYMVDDVWDVVVHGVVFGVGIGKPLTLKAKAAVQKHAQAIVRTQTAWKAAAAAGKKAEQLAKDLDAHRKKAAPVLAKLVNRPSGPIGQFKASPAGHVQIVAGYGLEVFGLDAAGNPPGAPGYDPSTEDGTGGGSSGYGGQDTSSAGYDAQGWPLPETYDPATDADLVPMPTRGEPLSKEEAQALWQTVPEDGFRYDGSQGVPSASVGSWSLMYDVPWVNEQSGHGYIWWSNPSEPQTWWRIENGHGDHGSEASMSDDQILSYSKRLGYGPLVGNPGGPLAGMQYAEADKAFFFQSSKAPPWLTAQADALIALTNQKTSDANRAAVDARNKRIAAEKAEADEAAAKQSAANELAASAASTQDQIQQQALATQSAAADLEQQRRDAQQAAAQAAANLQAQTLSQQAAAQSTAQDFAARQIQLDYLRAHPELLSQADDGSGDFAPAFDDQGDGGGGWDDSFSDAENGPDSPEGF